MQKKPIHKYLVSKIVINNNEVKYTNPEIFDKGLLASKFIYDQTLKNEIYTIQEILVNE